MVASRCDRLACQASEVLTFPYPTPVLTIGACCKLFAGAFQGWDLVASATMKKLARNRKTDCIWLIFTASIKGL